MTGFSRRSFLAGASLAVPALLAQGANLRAALADASAAMFPQSIASGDPSGTGVVLWTRIAPEQWRPREALRYEVAADARFATLVAKGEVPSADAPARDFTFRVLLDGRLQPGRVYFYRFRYRGTWSRTGRCRTLPVAGAPLDQLKLAVVTCQDFTHGYYGAFARIAADTSVDFVLHLGDFIYEGPEAGSDEGTAPGRGLALPSGQPRAMGLEDFRYLYRTYRSDPLLQRAMERHTWMILWDDHETANDCYWDYARDTLGAPDHVYQTNPAFFARPGLARGLKLGAQRAWAEWLPVRPVFNAAEAHPHRAMDIRRTFVFGDLAELFLTDERTYRSAHPCGEGGIGERTFAAGCEERFDPGRTMLGIAQRDWLVAGLTGSASRWKVWANEVLLSALVINGGSASPLIANTDAWDGYADERARILTACHDAGVGNLVVLTGDLHAYVASLVKLDFNDPDNADPDNVVGVEYMTPAVTSSNPVEEAGIEPPRAPDRFALEDLARGTNPHVQFFNAQDWGYSTVEFTREAVVYTAVKVDKDDPSPFAAARVLRQYRTPSGVARMDRLA